MPEADDLLSVQAAANRLGVSRWRVWQMIADGTLDVEPRPWHGRLVPGVRVTPEQPVGGGPSRMAQLQEQVERLSHTVRFLAALVTELSQDRIAARQKEDSLPPAPQASPGERVPFGITARPNPMTHPLSALEPVHVPSREEALAPTRSLFTRPTRRTWWQHGIGSRQI